MFIYSSCPLNRPTFWLFLFIYQWLHIFECCFLVEVPLYVNIPYISICVILTYNYIKQAVRRHMLLGIKTELNKKLYFYAFVSNKSYNYSVYTLQQLYKNSVHYAGFMLKYRFPYSKK